MLEIDKNLTLVLGVPTKPIDCLSYESFDWALSKVLVSRCRFNRAATAMVIQIDTEKGSGMGELPPSLPDPSPEPSYGVPPAKVPLIWMSPRLMDIESAQEPEKVSRKFISVIPTSEAGSDCVGEVNHFVIRVAEAKSRYFVSRSNVVPSVIDSVW